MRLKLVSFLRLKRDIYELLPYIQKNQPVSDLNQTKTL